MLLHVRNGKRWHSKRFLLASISDVQSILDRSTIAEEATNAVEERRQTLYILRTSLAWHVDVHLEHMIEWAIGELGAVKAEIVQIMRDRFELRSKNIVSSLTGNDELLNISQNELSFLAEDSSRDC